jgi:DNA mismatch repair ATPase MutS
LYLRPKLRPVGERNKSVRTEIALLWQGLALMEAQTFHDSKLRALNQRVKGASGTVRKLDRLIHAIDQCNSDWFFFPSRALLIDTQLALAIERWKAAHKKDLEEWLDAWGEFEALNALACYAHEHPGDVFPEILAGETAFDASSLGHPLLPYEACVRNDVHLDTERKFYLVSGSNMAGKSTFLRTIGLNAVLAAAGAPVRANHARLSAFAVCASLSIVDSLGEGKSKFMAEIQRLRETLVSASGPKPVLFVIDEIMSGTNSRDRRVATEAFLRALIGAGAIGALSTHDLALAEIAGEAGLGGCNVHMESRDPADPFAFDYLLKEGVSTHSNALAIARLAGVAV